MIHHHCLTCGECMEAPHSLRGHSQQCPACSAYNRVPVRRSKDRRSLILWTVLAMWTILMILWCAVVLLGGLQEWKTTEDMAMTLVAMIVIIFPVWLIVALPLFIAAVVTSPRK